MARLSLFALALATTTCVTRDEILLQPRWELHFVSVEVEGEEDTAAISAESAVWLDGGLLRDGKVDYILLEGVSAPCGDLVFSE